jgi:hypothetical protein
MENNIIITGIKNPELPERRLILYMDITYNDMLFKWEAFCPENIDFNEYLTNEQKQKIFNEIQAKITIWENLDPKHNIFIDPFSQEEKIIPITIEDVVKPDIPDYYTQRRLAYPPLGDQLDAVWKGIDSPEYALIQQKINEVKQKYPKPNY